MKEAYSIRWRPGYKTVFVRGQIFWVPPKMADELNKMMSGFAEDLPLPKPKKCQ